MRIRLEAALKGIESFTVENVEPAAERSKLRVLPEGSPELEEWREKLLDTVYGAHDIQEDESRLEELSFTEALMLVAKEMLTPVQLAGLFEALDSGGAGLVPETIATYAMANETEWRAARVRIVRKPEPLMPEGLLPKLKRYEQELLNLMIPEVVEFIQLKAETEDEFFDRIIHLTYGLHRAWHERIIEISSVLYG